MPVEEKRLLHGLVKEPVEQQQSQENRRQESRQFSGGHGSRDRSRARRQIVQPVHSRSVGLLRGIREKPMRRRARRIHRQGREECTLQLQVLQPQRRSQAARIPSRRVSHIRGTRRCESRAVQHWQSLRLFQSVQQSEPFQPSIYASCSAWRPSFCPGPIAFGLRVVFL